MVILGGAAAAEAPNDIYAPPNQVIVIDHSGSMGREAVTHPLLLEDIAGQTVQRLIETSAERLPSGRTGLVVFGHREPNGASPPDPVQKASSCRDVEVLSNPLPNTPASAASLEALARNIPAAKGQTPLVLSIRKAAELLPEGGFITVVTDLDKDVCTELDELCPDILREIGGQHEGDIFVRHIVALADAKSGTDQADRLSRCLNADLHAVRTSETAAAAADEIAADIERVSAPAVLRVGYSAGSAATVMPFGPSGDIEAEIIGAGQRPERVALKAGGAVSDWNTSPGQKTISAEFDGVRYATHVVAVRGQVTEAVLPIPLHATRLVAAPVEGAFDADVRVTWTIEKDGRLFSTVESSEIDVALPPGHFKLRAQANGVTGNAELIVAPNGGGPPMVELTLDQGGSVDTPAGEGSARLDVVLDLSCSLFADSGRRELTVVLRPDDGGPALSRKAGTSGLTPGNYSAFLTDGRIETPIGRVTAQSGDTVALVIASKGEALHLDAAPADSNTVWTVQNQHGETVVLAGRTLRQTLPPGQYRIKGEQAGGEREKTIDLPLNSGPLSELFQF